MSIAVIVPTVNRAHLLDGLVESIRASTTTDYAIHMVCERQDTETVAMVKQLGVDALIDDHGFSYTSSANAGVNATTEPYFIVANDDVIFKPGWDTAALAHMVDPVRVVGINQGSNGRTDCFFLVDRRYISEQSGVFDEPNTFYHGGYRSQYCDTEFCDLARQRGVWADAHDAVIEHHHWTFGLSTVDANYELAIASAEPDKRLYDQRRRLWAA